MNGKLQSRNRGVEIKWEVTRLGAARKLTVRVIPVWWNAIYSEEKGATFVGVEFTLKKAIEQIEDKVTAEVGRWEYMSVKLRDAIERPSTMKEDYPFMPLMHHGESQCVATNTGSTTITRPYHLLYK